MIISGDWRFAWDDEEHSEQQPGSGKEVKAQTEIGSKPERVKNSGSVGEKEKND